MIVECESANSLPVLIRVFPLCCQSGDEANQEKKGLENEITRCIQRLDRAEKLTSGLEEENVGSGRWMPQYKLA